MACATALGHMVIEGCSFEQAIWFVVRHLVLRDYSPGERVSLDGSNDDDDRYLRGQQENLDRMLSDLANLEAQDDDGYAMRQRERAIEISRACAEHWAQENAALDAMIAQISDWKIPPGVPEAVKAQAIDWLAYSKNPDPDAWYAKEIASIDDPDRQWTIDFLRRKIAESCEQIERHINYVASKRAWLATLNDVLPQPQTYTVEKVK